MLRILLVVLLIVQAPAALAQSTKERVTFRTLDTGSKVALSATFTRPAGSGKFPAMVLMHTCSGLARYIDDWSAWFVDQGYAALVIDSFGPRGVRNICAGGTPTIRTRALDALGGLVYLRSRPDIDPKRIGAIGWSQGAGAAFVADSKGIVAAASPSGGGFGAVVGLYVPCNYVRTPITAIVAPLLFLEGSADDWSPAQECQTDVDVLAQNGFPAAIHIYPGATHSFDNPADRGSIKVGNATYTLEYSPGAARDARDRVKTFLADVLK
jgi:dienelactone hydrolase